MIDTAAFTCIQSFLVKYRTWFRVIEKLQVITLQLCKMEGPMQSRYSNAMAWPVQSFNIYLLSVVYICKMQTVIVATNNRNILVLIRSFVQYISMIFLTKNLLHNTQTIHVVIVQCKLAYFHKTTSSQLILIWENPVLFLKETLKIIRLTVHKLSSQQ